MNPLPILALTLVLAVASNPSLNAQTSPPAPRTATFSMYCYWTGEATLGRVDGVLASRIGHWDGNEIVQVDYDPEVTNLAELVSALKGQNSLYSVVASSLSEGHDEAAADGVGDLAQLTGRPRFIDPKHSLRTRHPEIYALDLTEEQAIQLNSWSYFGGEMPEVLTPEQAREVSKH